MAAQQRAPPPNSSGGVGPATSPARSGGAERGLLVEALLRVSHVQVRALWRGASSHIHHGLVENLAPGNTALIVVDMQEYFCRPDSITSRFVAAFAQDDGRWYQQRLSTVVPKIARLIDAFRASGLPIAYTEFGSAEADGSDMPYFARTHNDWATRHLGDRCYRPLAEPSSRVISELAPAASDMIFQKVTSGPLAGTDISGRLRGLGVQSVIVTGIMTDACVTGMARELADSDFSATVVADACAAAEEASHDAGLRCLRNFAAIRDTDDVIAGLVARQRPAMNP